MVVDERIRPTLEAGSKIGSRKPVCLVIDEVDGATGAGDSVCCSRHASVVAMSSTPLSVHDLYTEIGAADIRQTE